MSSDIAIAQRAHDLLRGAKPAAYCDPCLADALALPLATVASIAKVLAGLPGVERKIGRCTPCRSTKRVVTRSLLNRDTRAAHVRFRTDASRAVRRA